MCRTGISTSVWVTGGTAVVLQAQCVFVGQQPAGGAVHVTVTGATASEVPDEDVLAGAFCHS